VENFKQLLGALTDADGNNPVSAGGHLQHRRDRLVRPPTAHRGLATSRASRHKQTKRMPSSSPSTQLETSSCKPVINNTQRPFPRAMMCTNGWACTAGTNSSAWMLSSVFKCAQTPWTSALHVGTQASTQRLVLLAASQPADLQVDGPGRPSVVLLSTMQRPLSSAIHAMA
jgi:hypothetical protein